MNYIPDKGHYNILSIHYELVGAGFEPLWGARFSSHNQTVPEAHPASCTMGTGSLYRGENGRGVALTSHPYLAPRLKGGAIPQTRGAFMACYGAKFTFYNIILILVVVK